MIVGFSKGVVEFAPKNPPPFVPRCLMDSSAATEVERDWIVLTSDGKLSAQWEITVAVTEDGAEVLTY